MLRKNGEPWWDRTTDPLIRISAKTNLSTSTEPKKI